jgi:DNA-binding MarR family transcriptional regulator
MKLFSWFLSLFRKPASKFESLYFPAETQLQVEPEHVDLSPVQSEILSYIKGYSPVEIHGLARLSGILEMSESTVTVNIRRLEEIGAVAVTRNNNNVVTKIEFVDDANIEYVKGRHKKKTMTNVVVPIVSSKVSVGGIWETTQTELRILSGTKDVKVLRRQLEWAENQGILEYNKHREGHSTILRIKRLR